MTRKIRIVHYPSWSGFFFSGFSTLMKQVNFHSWPLKPDHASSNMGEMGREERIEDITTPEFLLTCPLLQASFAGYRCDCSECAYGKISYNGVFYGGVYS